MSYELRQLQDELIDILNGHEDLPWESKRLVVECVLHLVEKKADEAIKQELMEGEQCRSLTQE